MNRNKPESTSSVGTGFSRSRPAEAGPHTSPETGQHAPTLGARLIAPNRCQFRVWAPKRDRVELHIVAPKERRVPLERDAAGYHQATVDAGPGTRNWGYDGVFIGAAQNSYGGPLSLKRLVDAAHARGLAVVLDVVYNHLGPEGNYLSQFGPYFTDRYKTAWGEAINFDGPHSDEVRWFFIQNALMWIDEFHVDALRVDAVHAIVDPSAEPFLQDLTT